MLYIELDFLQKLMKNEGGNTISRSGGRSSMQGVPWHIINRWELKPKDEFEWEVKEKSKRKKKKQKKKKESINYVELAKKQNQQNTEGYFGSFITKFEGEDEEKFIIGKNISMDAEILKIVSTTNEGEIFTINGEKALLVKKNISKKR